MFTCRLARLATPHIHLSALHHPQQQIQPHNQPRKHPGPHQTHHHQAPLESSCVVYTCTTPPTAGCEALNPGQANRPRAKKKLDTQKRLPPFKSSFTHFFHMRRRRGGSRYYVHVCCCPAQMARSSPVAALRRGGALLHVFVASRQLPLEIWTDSLAPGDEVVCFGPRRTQLVEPR